MPSPANPKKREFYVYHFRLDGYPFYVGIGRDQRDKDRVCYARSLFKPHNKTKLGKPPDATHAANALIANADELHKFDGKLLDLDGMLKKQDGTLLKIFKSGLGGPPLPLMEHAAKNDPGRE